MPLPLSVVAVAAGLVVMFTGYESHPAAQPTTVPPSVRPKPVAPEPVAPKAPAPAIDMLDKAFIEGLKRDGLPVPSRDYVRAQGRAVCDFLAHQPNFADAVELVQRTSIWDADQSADFAAAAIVSYCPQYAPAGPEEMQQSFQNALSDLQGIEGDLHRIRDDLQAITGRQ